MMAVTVENIFLGRIAKPFGIKGELKLRPSDDFWEEVLASKELFLRFSERAEGEHLRVEVADFRRQGEFFILKMVGVEDRTRAEELCGSDLFIPLEKLDIEFPGEALPFQIIGCRVETEEGEKLGEVTDLVFTPAHDVYEVTGPFGTGLIPAVPEFIRKVDIEEGLIVVRLIPGLFDL